MSHTEHFPYFCLVFAMAKKKKGSKIVSHLPTAGPPPAHVKRWRDGGSSLVVFTAVELVAAILSRKELLCLPHFPSASPRAHHHVVCRCPFLDLTLF